MSDDFQRGLQARLAHLIGEASQWSRGSGAHPPGLVKALNEAFEYGCAEIERLRDLIRTHICAARQQRDELLQAAKAALHYMRLHKYADQAWADDLERAIAKAEGRSDE